jgi:hypothetical protein
MKHLVLLLTLAACAAAPNSTTPAAVDSTPIDLRGLAYSNGLPAQNGVTAVNGLVLSNGLAYSNGLMYSNGLIEIDGMTYGHKDAGLDVHYPLTDETGLSSQYGYVAHPVGRTFVKYLVECALGPNDRVTKGPHVFMGRLGLAPHWRTGQCDVECQQWVTACLLARTNAQGANVKIELRAAHPAIGLGVAEPTYTAHEGGFFGNAFATHASSYACQGSGLAAAVAQNRLCADGQCAGIMLPDYRSCNGCANGRCPSSSWAGAVTFPVIDVWVKP